MKLITLDAAGWTVQDDFYAALLPQLGAPDWHGWNLDALWDSLRGDINEIDPPYKVRVLGGDNLSVELTSFLRKVAEVYEAARRDLGADVSIEVV